MPDPQAAPVQISSLQLATLQQLVRRTTSAQRLVKRSPNPGLYCLLQSYFQRSLSTSPIKVLLLVPRLPHYFREAVLSRVLHHHYGSTYNKCNK
jgi:hypothetical protein